MTVHNAPVSYPFVLVDAFSDVPFGGNQLAVIPRAEGLTDRRMQSIAREFNFAETAFVLPPSDPANTARLRIFSPGAEMPFAGHPTIGAAAVLHRSAHGHADSASSVTFEEQVGLVRVQVSTEKGLTYSELTLETTLGTGDHEPDPVDIAAVLGLSANAVQDTWFAGIGLNFCFCQLRRQADVDAAVLDKEAWTRVLRDSCAPSVFFFSGDLTDAGRLYARMFAPAIGVDEDPATGSASAILAAVLAERAGLSDARVSLLVEQGHAMQRPSTIRASATTIGTELHSVSVGGHVAFFAAGTLERLQSGC
jgi:trans-2,3-dihydro-3-hydroxyanthranilate isomerase